MSGYTSFGGVVNRVKEPTYEQRLEKADIDRDGMLEMKLEQVDRSKYLWIIRGHKGEILRDWILRTDVHGTPEEFAKRKEKEVQEGTLKSTYRVVNGNIESRYRVSFEVDHD